MHSNGGIKMRLAFGTACQDVARYRVQVLAFWKYETNTKNLMLGYPWRGRKPHVMGRNANV
jgi:hypothetical protein